MPRESAQSLLRLLNNCEDDLGGSEVILLTTSVKLTLALPLAAKSSNPYLIAHYMALVPTELPIDNILERRY